MRLRVIVTLALALCLGVSSAWSHSIGIYGNSTGTSCRLNNTGAPISYWVLALLDGPLAAGITGCEFRIDLPPTPVNGCAWSATWTKNVNANVGLGDPWSGGVNVAWPTCALPTGSFLLIGNGKLYPGATDDPDCVTPDLSPQYLTVQKHSTPSNPLFLCPLFTQCDQAYTLICTQGGSVRFNAPCTVAVTPTTWSTVKGLYRN